MSDSSNGTYTAPYAIVTATDRGGQLLTVDAVILTLTIFSIFLRVYISSRETAHAFAFYKDDLMCFAATVSSLASPAANSC
jgi:hypothetical protein